MTIHHEDIEWAGWMSENDNGFHKYSKIHALCDQSDNAICGSAPEGYVEWMDEQDINNDRCKNCQKLVKKRTNLGDGDGSKTPDVNPIHAKLGTQSHLLYIHPLDTIDTDSMIRYKEHPWEPYTKWLKAWVHNTHPVPFLEKM